MIYLRLFLTFLEIGAVSFGGGYGMISLIREKCLANAWLTDAELMNFIAVSESTPGPIAVNIATFIGSSQGGFFGALCATLGVVLPSFFIILLIASVMQKLMQFPPVRALIDGIKPVVVGLILATSVTMFLSTVLSFRNLQDASGLSFDPYALGIFLAVAEVSFGYKRLRKKKISPILLILFSAVLGILLYAN